MKIYGMRLLLVGSIFVGIASVVSLDTAYAEAPPSASCNLDNLDITLSGSDGPFTITGSGPGLPLTVAEPQTVSLAGPAAWQAVVVTGASGNPVNLGDFACGVTASSAYLTWYNARCVGTNLVIQGSLVSPEGLINFTIEGSGPQFGGSVDLLASLVNEIFTVTLRGPGTWKGLYLQGYGHDEYDFNIRLYRYLGNFTCDGTFNPITDPLPPNAPLEPELPAASATFTNEYGVPRIVELLTAAPTIAYDAPNGNPISIDGMPLQLPSDADANGYDTYVVVGVVEIEGVLWVALNLGSRQPVYIQYSN